MREVETIWVRCSRTGYGHEPGDEAMHVQFQVPLRYPPSPAVRRALLASIAYCVAAVTAAPSSASDFGVDVEGFFGHRCEVL